MTAAARPSAAAAETPATTRRSIALAERVARACRAAKTLLASLMTKLTHLFI